jgi:hypothetical protein
MRPRIQIVYAATACAGTAGLFVGVTGLVGCVGDDGSAPAPTGGLDASLPDGSAGIDGSTARDGSSATDAQTADGAANGDGASSSDGSTEGDGGTNDGSSSLDGAVVCAPGNVTGFVPPPFVHSAQQFTAGCSEHDTTAFTVSCASDASTYETCSSYPFEALLWGENPMCTSCLVGPEITLSDDAGSPDDAGDASPAPPPVYGGAITARITIPNVAGCVELTDPSDAGVGCATAIQAAWRCAEYACNPTCPVHDDATQAAYVACTQAAATSVCSTYAGPAAACLEAETDAGGQTYAQCLGPSLGFYDQSAADTPTGAGIPVYNIAQFFCNS